MAKVNLNMFYNNKLIENQELEEEEDEDLDDEDFGNKRFVQTSEADDETIKTISVEALKNLGIGVVYFRGLGEEKYESYYEFTKLPYKKNSLGGDLKRSEMSSDVKITKEIIEDNTANVHLVFNIVRIRENGRRPIDDTAEYIKYDDGTVEIITD